jgi:hypothetical protein
MRRRPLRASRACNARPLYRNGDVAKRILVVGTADTKGDELAFPRTAIAEAGAVAIVVDVGVGAPICAVDMKLADRIGLEFALRRGFAFDLRHPRDPVTLKTPVQRRARQMRDGRLQGVEAVVERQQRMPSEGDDDGFFLD